MASRVLIMVATRKGAWLFHGDAARRSWRADGPHFLGHVINHLVLDPRDRPHAARRGQDRPPRPDDLPLDRPRPTWKEAARPPAFAKAADGEQAAPSTTPSG